MNNLDEAITNLKKDLLDDPLIKRYLSLEKLVNSSKELNELKKEIDYLKKCDISEEDKLKYKELMKKYNNDPLIIEFKNVSDEVYNLLNEIKEEIENWLFVLLAQLVAEKAN